MSVIKNIKKTINSKPWIFISNPAVFKESLLDYLSFPRNHIGNNEIHILHAIQWLCRAQDATLDGGVSRSYSMVYHPYFERKGWFDSYPETTGYIIPTFLDYYHITGDDEYFQRAIKMADWECETQMESGGVMGGMVSFKPVEAVFNTGQVIFGWCRSFLETDDGKYLDCAKKAGDFLVKCQDSSGAWIKFSPSPPVNVYNTRTSWALLLLDSLVNTGKYKESAIRNIKWALSKQKGNGWFSDNCLDDPRHPLTHTIGYAVQGILEAGFLLDDNIFIKSALKTASVLANSLNEDGSLSGRFDENWEPVASWSCLTGNMQLSIVWSRIHQNNLGKDFEKKVSQINNFTKKFHNLNSHQPGVRGGIKGAFPIYGDYGTFEYLNWASKFFIDSLLMEEKSKRKPAFLSAEKKCPHLFWGS